MKQHHVCEKFSPCNWKLTRGNVKKFVTDKQKSIQVHRDGCQQPQIRVVGKMKIEIFHSRWSRTEEVDHLPGDLILRKTEELKLLDTYFIWCAGGCYQHNRFRKKASRSQVTKKTTTLLLVISIQNEDNISPLLVPNPLRNVLCFKWK